MEVKIAQDYLSHLYLSLLSEDATLCQLLASYGKPRTLSGGLCPALPIADQLKDKIEGEMIQDALPQGVYEIYPSKNV